MSIDFLKNIDYKNKFNVIDIKQKIYDNDSNKIVFDDNIVTVIEKITYNCNKNINIDEIYVWYLDNSNKIKSLYFDYTDDIMIKNPIEDTPDVKFLDDDNNFMIKTIIYNNSCINNIDIKDNNLYFISIYELLNGISSDKIYINGLIKKYFPNLNDKTILDITKNKKPTKKKIKEIEKQRRCLEISNDTSNLIYNNSDSNTDEFHFKFIKINNDDSKNDVDIVKIFAKLNTNINVPFIKLYLNDFTESYYKLYNDYYKKFIVDSDKIYSWIKNKPIVINDGLYYISQKNTLTIYFNLENTYFKCNISIDGTMSIIIDESINSKKLNDIIKYCNDYIKKYINENNIYSVEDIQYIDYNWSKKYIYDKNIELFNYILKFKKNTSFNSDKYIVFLNNLFVFFRPINEKSDIFKYIFKRVNDYDELSIEEILYYKYRNPPYNFDDKEIKKNIIDELLIKDDGLDERMNGYREKFINKRRYNKNNIGPEIIIYFDTININIDINGVKTIDEYYRLYKIFTNINTLYNNDDTKNADYFKKNKLLNTYKKNCIYNIQEDVYVHNNEDSEDDIDIENMDDLESILEDIENDSKSKESSSDPTSKEKQDSPPTEESSSDPKPDSPKPDSPPTEESSSDPTSKEKQDSPPTEKSSDPKPEEIIEGSTVEFTSGGKKVIGTVEKITKLKYKVCCKPGKSRGEKASVYMIDKNIVKLVKEQSGGGENLFGYYAKRLKNYDKKLFLWSAKSNGVERVQYSKTCDATTQRQPIVVNDEELKRINMSEDLGSGRKSYKNVMKYGSDPNSQYNYICPQYWDAKEKLSLDPNSDKWDRNKIFKKGENIKNTDNTILERSNKYWTTLPPIVKDAEVKNPDLNLPVPCCFNNMVKDVNAETEVITQNELCYKNYCKLNDGLNTYLNFNKENDNIFLKKGIGEHTILDSLIHILNSENIIDTDEMLKNSNIETKFIESFFDNISVKNRIYTNDTLDYDIVKYNILNYFKIKTFDKSLKIIILKYSLLIQYFEKTKNVVYNDLDRNIIRKCINIENQNFSKDKCIICKFSNKGKERTGVVEKITPKSYRVCCKPGTNNYDTTGNLYSIPYKKALEICVEYDPKEKCKEYDITLDDIQNGIEYLTNILNNIDEVYNSFVIYIKKYIFKQKCIEFIKSDNFRHFGKSGNGYITDKFKKYKKNISMDDIKQYNKIFNKNYKDIDDMYEKFQDDMMSFNSFNIFTASQKYIEYLENSKFLDDIYILPIVQSYLKSLGKNINSIVFENVKNTNYIKKQYYDIDDNSKNIIIYKKGKDYEPLCFKKKKVYNYIYDINDINFIIDDIKVKDENILINAKIILDNFDINKAYINNNFMTHLITEDNIFIPIQKCYIEDLDLELIFDIENIEKPKYDDVIEFYKNPLFKNYIPKNVIVSDKICTLVFNNDSYIPVKYGKFKKFTNGKNLFQLDEQICLQNDKNDKNFEYIENIDIIMENIEDYIGFMLVEFKNKNKRYLDTKNIDKYSIGKKYKGETITNIITTDILENIGIIYTYDSILEDINDILNDKNLDRDKKQSELFERLKHMSEKNIKKCKDIELINLEDIHDIFLYRFIELLCIYGINKNDRKNVYNCEKDIELHLLHMTIKRDETFLSYSDNIKENIESLYDYDNIY